MKNSTARNASRIWTMVQKLSQSQKMRILNMLEKQLRTARWDTLTEKLSRPRRLSVSDEEITQAVEEVRQARYEAA